MSPLLTSTALGLIAAWPVGALGLGLGRLVERLTDDPRPRAAAWSLAYALPAGALAATLLLTVSPAPAPQPPPPVAAERVVATLDMSAAEAAPAWTPPPMLANGLAWSLVGLSAAGLLARGWRWNRGRRRLAQIRAAAEPCQDHALVEAVRARAARLGVKAPRVRISAAVAEPLLAGVRRPAILLPRALVQTADTRRLDLVCGHELAHLRRGDNWRIPAEEALAGLFWLVPPVKALRGRMLAAREAVCDLTALDGAPPEARRAYARVLVEALRTNGLPSPQSAFTGRERSLAALRLAAILQPQGRASTLRLGLTLALGGALTAATGAGSLALAEQARRLAPPETLAAAEAAAAIAAEDAAPATGAVEAAAADAAPTASARAATPAAEATEAPEPLSAPMAANVATDPTPAFAPMHVRLGPNPNPKPNPNPNPNPHPDPHPDPHPNPQPNPRPKSKLTGLEFRADEQQTFNGEDKVVFIGDVEVRGRVDPVNVVVKVNGVQASPWFQPADLRVGVIQRVEVTNARAGAGTPVVNVVLK